MRNVRLVLAGLVVGGWGATAWNSHMAMTHGTTVANLRVIIEPIPAAVPATVTPSPGNPASAAKRSEAPKQPEATAANPVPTARDRDAVAAKCFDALLEFSLGETDAAKARPRAQKCS